MNLISQHPAELILDVGNDLFDDVVDVFILEGAANILEGEVKGDRFIARFNLFARIDIEDADVYEEGTAFFADFGFKVACGDTRFYNDGDQLGIGYGKETCNPAGRFLGAKGNDKIAKLTADAWAVYSEEAYEKVLDILCGAVADYVEQNPDLRNQPTEDMWDFKDEEEDQDDDWDEEEDDWDEEDYDEEEDY